MGYDKGFDAEEIFAVAAKAARTLVVMSAGASVGMGMGFPDLANMKNRQRQIEHARLPVVKPSASSIEQPISTGLIPDGRPRPAQPRATPTPDDSWDRMRF